LPIDTPALAEHFGVDPDIVFGRLYYHLEAKYGQEQRESDRGRRSFFTSFEGFERRTASSPRTTGLRSMDYPTSGAPRGATAILVVEANAIVRTMLRRALERRDYHVLLATNAESALALFEHSEEPIGLVISEQPLSGMNGGRLADELRRRDPTIPILLVGSGLDGPGDYPEVDKPFTRDVLERRIAEVLTGVSDDRRVRVSVDRY
jgi:CheY-like chemotaxis protein